jgi:hypothetical protein
MTPRYRMQFLGSRSCIADDLQPNSVFPLYFKNAEERRFECGVFLLNKDVEQLLDERVKDWNKMIGSQAGMLECLALLLEQEVPRLPPPPTSAAAMLQQQGKRI